MIKPIILKVLVSSSIKGSIIETTPLALKFSSIELVKKKFVFVEILFMKLSGTFACIFSLVISYIVVIISPGFIKEPSLKFLILVMPAKGADIVRSLIVASISSNLALSFSFNIFLLSRIVCEIFPLENNLPNLSIIFGELVI